MEDICSTIQQEPPDLPSKPEPTRPDLLDTDPVSYALIQDIDIDDPSRRQVIRPIKIRS